MIKEFARTHFRRQPVLNDSIWILGCSLIFGENVDNEYTVASQLARMTGHTVDNMGINGASPELCMLVHDEFRKEFTPRAVVMCWPNADRCHVDHDGEILRLGPWIFVKSSHPAHAYPDLLEKYRQRVLSNEIYLENQARMNSWHDSKIDQDGYFSGMYHDYMRQGNTQNLPPLRINGFLDAASDLIHPGPQSHAAVARALAAHLTPLLNSV